MAEAALGKEGPKSASCCDSPSRHLLLPHWYAEPLSPSAALGPQVSHEGTFECTALFVACCHGINDCENSYYGG